jgi:hypothetical protein
MRLAWQISKVAFFHPSFSPHVKKLTDGTPSALCGRIRLCSIKACASKKRLKTFAFNHSSRIFRSEQIPFPFTLSGIVMLSTFAALNVNSAKHLPIQDEILRRKNRAPE